MILKMIQNDVTHMKHNRIQVPQHTSKLASTSSTFRVRMGGKISPPVRTPNVREVEATPLTPTERWRVENDNLTIIETVKSVISHVIIEMLLPIMNQDEYSKKLQLQAWYDSLLITLILVIQYQVKMPHKHLSVVAFRVN